MAELGAAEVATVRWGTQLAAVARMNVRPDSETARWHYGSVAELLLAHGRLFTPSPPDGVLGPAKACYRNASERADAHTTEVYVEGLASTTAVMALEHAWCAAGPVAIDPTWTDGASYLGIAFTHDYRRQRQNDTDQWSLLWSPSTLELLREGLPSHAVADAGRPLPTSLVADLSGEVPGANAGY